MIKLIKDNPPERALVVDALNLAFRWKHQKAEVFAEAYIDTVKSLARSYTCGTIILAADWGSSTYRKDLFEDYKGNRKKLQEQQTPEEAEYFKVFIQEYERCLEEGKKSGFRVARFKGVEADDIAACIVNEKESLGYARIWLVSSDKDWDLLIDETTHRFSYVTRKETTLDNWAEHYEIPPEKYLSYKCLTGDAGDNIPGVEGIGPKRASGIINEYGDVFDIVTSLPLPGKAKYIQNLNSSAEQLLLNVELMDLLSYYQNAIGQENLVELRDGIRL